MQLGSRVAENGLGQLMLVLCQLLASSRKRTRRQPRQLIPGLGCLSPTEALRTV